MALTTWTLTGDLSTVVGTDYDSVTAVLNPIQASGNEFIHDAAGAATRLLQSIPLTVAADGTFTIAGVPDSAAYDVEYQIVVTPYLGNTRKPGIALPKFTVVENVDLAEAPYVPPSVSESEILANATDTVMAGVASDDNSAFRVELDLAYAPTEALRATALVHSEVARMDAQACASGHGWVAASGNTATLDLNDTGYAPIGSQSIEMVSAGSSGANRIDATVSLDLSGRSPVLWLSCDDVSELNGISLYLGSSGFSAYYLWQYIAPKMTGVNEMQDGEFVKIVLNWGDATTSGSPNRAAIAAARFYFQDVGTGPCTVRFSGLGSQPEPASRYPSGVLAFSFDDAYVSQFTGARPTLDKYGYPATAYVIAERVGSSGSFMSLAQVKQLQNQSGWEIASHAYSTTLHDQTNAFAAATEAELVEDMRLMKQWLVANGLRGGDHFAFPQDKYNSTVLDVARRFYASGRRNWGKPDKSETWPPADRMRIQSRQLSSGSEATLASIQAAVDRAVANKGALILTGHKLGGTADSLTWTQADFDSLVAYVAASGIAVRTVGQLLRGE